MEQRGLHQFLRGLWSFTREVRSLTSNHLMASVDDGLASFIPMSHLVENLGKESNLSSESNGTSATGPKQMVGQSGCSNDGQSDAGLSDLLYREKGTMITYDGLNQQKMQGSFTRQYLYCFTGSDSVDVYHCEHTEQADKTAKDPTNMDLQPSQFKGYQKTNFFHKLEINDQVTVLDDKTWATNTDNKLCSFFTHYCDPDTYEGQFSIHNGDRTLTTSWKVTGPNKSYNILTKYVKEMNSAC